MNTQSDLARWAGRCVLALVFVLPQAGAAYGQENFQDFVIIGDSLSDTGNRFFDEGSMNTPPYELAAAQNLIPSLPYAIGGPTYTNGKVWIEYVVQAIGRSGASQAALRSDGIGANYAYAGALASNAAPLPPNANRNLADQVAQYIADAGPGGISADTLHVIFIGGNDIGGAIFLASQVPDPVLREFLVNQVLQNATASMFIQAAALASAGAHRFLFLTAVNVGFIPAFGGNPAAIFLGGQLASAFNCAVVGINPSFECPLLPPGDPTVAGLLTGLFGAEVSVFDSRTLFDDFIANPSNYGLTNTSTPCIKPFEPPFQCESPDQNLYWDNIHPTAAVHEIVGNAVIDALND